MSFIFGLTKSLKIVYFRRNFIIFEGILVNDFTAEAETNGLSANL